MSAAILNQRPPSAAKADGGAGRVILSKASHFLASARVFPVLDKTIVSLRGRKDHSARGSKRRGIVGLVYAEHA